MLLCWTNTTLTSQIFARLCILYTFDTDSFALCWWLEGKECPANPALEEWRVCNDHPCTVFYWEVSAWGPCIEDTSTDVNGTSFWNGTPNCAVGVEIRKVNCMKLNAGTVISKR